MWLGASLALLAWLWACSHDWEQWEPASRVPVGRPRRRAPRLDRRAGGAGGSCGDTQTDPATAQLRGWPAHPATTASMAFAATRPSTSRLASHLRRLRNGESGVGAATCSAKWASIRRSRTYCPFHQNKCQTQADQGRGHQRRGGGRGRRRGDLRAHRAVRCIAGQQRARAARAHAATVPSCVRPTILPPAASRAPRSRRRSRCRPTSSPRSSAWGLVACIRSRRRRYCWGSNLTARSRPPGGVVAPDEQRQCRCRRRRGDVGSSPFGRDGVRAHVGSGVVRCWGDTLLRNIFPSPACVGLHHRELHPRHTCAVRTSGDR